MVGDGAGIYIEGFGQTPASVAISASNLTDNHADNQGGAIFAGYDVELTITGGTLISGNQARYGGGIFAAGGGEVFEPSEMTITSSDVADNLAEHDGGGIYAWSGAIINV